MKYVTRSLFALFGFLTILNTQFSTASAQGTAFTYQGRLSNNGSPASGIYNIQFTLYTTGGGAVIIAGPLTNSTVIVTNGLFTTLIDFGPGIFTGQNCWLDIAVSTNGNSTFTELSPRQPVTPAPYAIMANSASNLLGTLPTAQLMGAIAATNLSGAIPSANFSGTYGNVVSFGNGADSFDGDFFGQFFGSLFQGGTFTGQFLGDGSGLININPAHINGQIAFLNSNQTFTAQNVFMQSIGLGNSNPSPNAQIDALAAQSNVRMMSTNTGFGAVLELRNLSSYPGEYIGAINFNNTNNYYPGQIGYIAANPTNELDDYFEFRVGGTVGLTIQADPRGDEGANIIGGFPQNSVSIVGSGGNVIAGGGYFGIPNTISSNSSGNFIGAGSGNLIGNSVDDSVISGGYINTIQSYDSVIAGGDYNTIPIGAQYAVIGGGDLNTNAGYASVIAGGVQNLIQPVANYSLIGGGDGNTIQIDAYDSVIAGGIANTIQSNAILSFIGGGDYNYIHTNAQYSFIGGGLGNAIQNAGSYSFIGMGYYNNIGATNFGDFIGGGQGNLIDSYNTISVIGGGLDNRISGNYLYYSNFYAIGHTIAGGIINVIDTNGLYDTVGGGWDNVIQSNSTYSTIAGGGENIILTNAVGSVVSGGGVNQAGGLNATVPGGYENVATGASSFAAGTQAQATNNGAFVLADYELTNFTSTASNQLSARFTGGIRLVTGGAGMTLDGQPILSSASGAPASGSANYIQNQSAVPQSASFNVSGNGAVGGVISANSLTISNQFRVAGAGLNTSTAAFIQLSASTNLNGDQTIIYNPACDGDPNAILIATHNYSAGTAGFHNHAIGVYYNSPHWTIYNDDGATMVTGEAFNVLVIKH